MVRSKDTPNIAIILGILALGVVIGMILSFVLLYTSTENFISTILSNIQIENINFNLNETALVDAMNNTFGGPNGKN